MPVAQNRRIILASASETRRSMLRNAGLEFEVVSGRIDEDAVRASLIAGGAEARELADSLAEMKAMKTSDRINEALVIGADQILECDGRIFAKAGSSAELVEHLRFLSGKTHRLHSAAVVCENGRAIWRSIGTVGMTMHALSENYLKDYVARNWETIQYAVGGYMIESEGVRLFSRIEGDFFHILGLPLLELLTWLRIRGDIAA